MQEIHVALLQSINQSINLSIYLSINQSINESISQSVCIALVLDQNSSGNLRIYFCTLRFIEAYMYIYSQTRREINYNYCRTLMFLVQIKLKICLNCILTILCSFPEVNLVFKLRFFLCLYLESINEIVSPSPVSKRVFTFIKICP